MSTFNDLITFTRSTTGTYLDSVVYGDELVVNGDFATDSDWTVPSAWDISDGVATATNGDGSYSTSALRQPLSLELGKLYKVSVDVSSITGQVRLYQNVFSSGFPITETGVVTGFLTGEGAVNLNLLATAGSSAVIDNVSVKEVIGGQVSGTPLLRTAAINEPRLEYDAQGNALGLLIEEARTNFVTYSNELLSAPWVGYCLNVVSNIPSIDGGQCFKLSSNGGSSDYWIQSEVASNGQRKSIWARTVSGTGTAHILGHNSAPTTLVTLTEEWQRFSLDVDVGETGGTNFYAVDFRGSGTLSEILVFGAQVETGSFPTSYIPTSGSTVTRAVDSAVATLSNFYYRQKNGSMFVEFTSKYDESTALFNRVYEIGNADTNSNRIMTYVKTDETRLSCSVWDNNVFQAGTTLTTSLPNGTGVYSKTAYAWETNNARAALDGNLVGSVDTSVSLTQTRDTLGIMRAPVSGVTLTGHIKSIQYYPLRLADARLETLTS